MKLPIAKIKKETRKLIQDKRNEKQGMISEMKDFYDPVIVNPIKKTIDENQDKLIDQLQDEQKDIKNTLALTQGKKLNFNVGSRFNEFDRETIKKYNLKDPYLLLTAKDDELKEAKDRLNELASKIGPEKAKITKKGKNKTNEDIQKYEYYKNVKETLKEYRKLLETITYYGGDWERDKWQSSRAFRRSDNGGFKILYNSCLLRGKIGNRLQTHL